MRKRTVPKPPFCPGELVTFKDPGTSITRGTSTPGPKTVDNDLVGEMRQGDVALVVATNRETNDVLLFVTKPGGSTLSWFYDFMFKRAT